MTAERMFNSKLIDAINNLACVISAANSQQAVLERLGQLERNIMANQAELAAQLTADLKTANTQLKKLIVDSAGLQPAVDALKDKISALEALIAAGGAGGSITQEMIDLAAETKALTQTVDDNVPELPTPPTPA